MSKRVEKEKERIIQNALRVARLFESATEIHAQIVLSEDAETDEGCMGICSFCRWLDETDAARINCRSQIMQAGKNAAELGGKHFFFCQTGFVHFVAPVLWRKELIATAVSDPIVLHPTGEDAANAVLQRFRMPASLLNEAIKRIISLPAISPEKISSAAELLSMVIRSAAGASVLPFAEHTDSPLPYGYFNHVEPEFHIAIAAESKPKIMLGIKGIINHILTAQSKNKTNIKNLFLEFALLLSRIASDCKHDGDFSGRLSPQLLRLEQSREPAEMRLCILEISEAFADTVLAGPSMKHNDIIGHTVDYIRQNYMTKITLESAAAHVFLSPSYLSKIFKEETGLNFSNFLNQVRIEHAKHLLLSENVDLINIATLVGYEDQSYFSKVFKRMTGVTPKKFKSTSGTATPKDLP